MPEWMAMVARILVGVAFLMAGTSKLAAGNSWRQQGSDLGAPSWMLPAVPFFELVLGACLLVGLIDPIPALMAMLALVVFSVLIASAMRAPTRPTCACFGAWSRRPVGWRDLVRNAALFGLALLSVVP